MHPIFAFVTGPEIAIILGVAVLLFGADRIPKLARSMGEAKKEFEAAQRGKNAEVSSVPSDTAADSAPQTPPPAPQA